MRAHEASSMYSEEKAKLLRKISSEVELKDTQLNEFMSSLQLDELNILNEPERYKVYRILVIINDIFWLRFFF